MTLEPGGRLGPYEILGPLGAGGMGEVYRARDTRLGREVAVKVLPAGRAATAEARARFEREARAIANLHHPHVCTLFDVGREGEVEYLVMERLEGEPLSARLLRGPLPPAEALQLGVQIADALAAAHLAGIVHRDLKPANIMLTKTGAKLLDFGLARGAGVSGGPADLTQSPTVTRPLTTEGAIVGTFQYMSPEQLEGRDADARSDVFAFGATLYEAVTGRRAFEGRSQASLIAAILKEQPRPPSELQPLAPPALDRVVAQCLAKDPAERWQSASDLRRELEWISQGGSGVAAAVGVRPAAPARPARRGPAPWVAAALPAALAVIAVVLRLLPAGPPRLNPDMRTRPLDVPMSGIGYPGLSQDGRWVALPARDSHGVRGLYFMNVAGGEVRPIAEDTTAGATYADISPDGSQVAFTVVRTRDAVSELRVVPALGGAARTLAVSAYGPHWSPDGRRIGYQIPGTASRSGHLEFWTVAPEGGAPVEAYVDTTCTGRNRFSFAWSPDGRSIAWLRGFGGDAWDEVVIRDLASGRERQLTHDHRTIDELVWTRQNEIVFSSNRSGASNLWIVRASGGPAAQVTRGAGPDVGVRVSADGSTLLYLNTQALARVWWADLATGEARALTREDLPITSLALSPDGRWVAAPVHDLDPLKRTARLLLLGADGSQRPLTFADEYPTIGLDWSPDGRRVLWITHAGSPERDSLRFDVFDPATGAAGALGTVPAVPLQFAYWMSADQVLLPTSRGEYQFTPGTGRFVPVSAESTIWLPFSVPGARIHLDLRDGRKGVYVQPEGGPPRLLMPLAWTMLAWPLDEPWILCWPDSLGLSRLQVPGGRLEPFAHPPAGFNPNDYASISRDGRHLAWLEPREASKLVLIENLHK